MARSLVTRAAADGSTDVQNRAHLTGRGIRTGCRRHIGPPRRRAGRRGPSRVWMFGTPSDELAIFHNRGLNELIENVAEWMNGEEFWARAATFRGPSRLIRHQALVSAQDGSVEARRSVG